MKEVERQTKNENTSQFVDSMYISSDESSEELSDIDFSPTFIEPATSLPSTSRCDPNPEKGGS